MSVDRPAPAVIPSGFTATPSGLVVPTGTTEKAVERWDWKDAKHIVRAQDVARAHGLTLILGCNHDACVENPQITERLTDQGGLTWTCGHLDRIVTSGRLQPERRRWPR